MKRKKVLKISIVIRIMGLLCIQYLSYSRTLYIQSADLYYEHGGFTHGNMGNRKPIEWYIVTRGEQNFRLEIDIDQIHFINTENLDKGKIYRILLVCLINEELKTDRNVLYIRYDENIVTGGFIGWPEFLNFSFYSDILPLLLIFEILAVFFFIFRKISSTIPKNVQDKQTWIPLQESLSKLLNLRDEIQ